VREYIDEQVKAGITNSYLWLNDPTFSFYLHRSFSILVLVLNFYLFFLNKKLDLGFKNVKWVIILLILEVFTGILMQYFYFPFGSQALHLVLASILFGVQYYLFLQAKKCYYVGERE